MLTDSLQRCSVFTQLGQLRLSLNGINQSELNNEWINVIIKFLSKITKIYKDLRLQPSDIVKRSFQGRIWGRMTVDPVFGKYYSWRSDLCCGLAMIVLRYDKRDQQIAKWVLDSFLGSKYYWWLWPGCDTAWRWKLLKCVCSQWAWRSEGRVVTAGVTGRKDKKILELHGLITVVTTHQYRLRLREAFNIWVRQGSRSTRCGKCCLLIVADTTKGLQIVRNYCPFHNVWSLWANDRS